VEFLVDSARRFYFLEMNTRLQVEHPVTEMVLGIDLVKEQIRIAAGLPLEFGQKDVQMKGAAVECRIYAEDPENHFFPSPGTIRFLRTPAGPGIRDDSGVYEGWTVPMDYDPLISKLIAWGPTREEAIHRMLRALEEYRIEGIRTNLAFFRQALENSNFRGGDFDTGFIDRWLSDRPRPAPPSERVRDLAVIAAALEDSLGSPAPTPTSSPASRWKSVARLRGLRR
jgi:acetyl-CoA carboxylase biotin carboxylase subunit